MLSEDGRHRCLRHRGRHQPHAAPRHHRPQALPALARHRLHRRFENRLHRFDLARWGFAFDDGKGMTPTYRDMGFRDVPRGDYLARLSDAVRLAGKPGRWLAEADATSAADWHSAKP